jgi:hypothetical protein
MMSTLAEIEEAIAKLPPTEFRELLRRLRERESEAWDRQIEEDAHSEKLQALYSRLMEGESDQPKVPLDEVLDEPELS